MRRIHEVIGPHAPTLFGTTLNGGFLTRMSTIDGWEPPLASKVEW